MRSVGRILTPHLKRRLLSTQPASKVAEQSTPLQKQDAILSRLPNGVVVASLENYSPITRIAALFKAGSRYECQQTLGVSHCLRILSSQATSSCSALGLTRNLNQTGGTYTCSTTRDHLIYTVESLRTHAELSAEYLSYASCQPIFKPWEITDNQEKLQYDLAVLDTNSQQVMVEKLHEASYRTNLGRSMFAPEFKVGNFNPELLQDFVRRFCTTGRMAVVGTGIDHDLLVQYARQFTPTTGPGAEAEKAQYRSGEVRVNTDHGIVHAALVTEGAPVSAKESLCLSVMQHVMGAGPFVKYSTNLTTNKLVQAAAQVTNNPFTASCINLGYSDSGLFGFTVIGHAEDMEKLMKAAVGQFRQVTKGAVSEQDIQRAKNQVKASIMMNGEDGATVLEDLAFQALVNGELQSTQSRLEAVDALTTDDIINVAKKVINGKPSMAAVGNLGHTPYLDALV